MTGAGSPSAEPDHPDDSSAASSSNEAAELRHWQLVEELFHRATESLSDLSVEDRALRIAEWSGGDETLCASVLELLEADHSVDALISNAAATGPSEAGTQDFLLRETDGESSDSGVEDQEEAQSEDVEENLWVGRVLGAFRLDKLIGRGGMGVVYAGQRVSGGFSQRVAVKLVGRHLRSSPAVAQFLVERETLAKLEHRNIARLLDGGVTEEGFPYVVMEYVEGRRLDAACDDPSTTIEQMIRWMLELCEAVTYVHRNLILHRDLKPGNVMVTSDGVVKLLDFGTLKRIGPGGDTDSAMTQAGMRPVTVRYASPEHIQGTAASTATDVYSLGMILYRLIAGRLPQGLDNLPIGRYLERLKEGRFKPPSQARAAQKATAGRPIDSPPATGPHSSDMGSSDTDLNDLDLNDLDLNDLDAIVEKAIRYEAEARYPTADTLASDLWSLLLERPVTAHAGGLRYRAEKYYRRHTWTIRAAAAAALVLVLGVGAMAWQGHRARIQEARAEKGVEDERLLAHMLLFDYFEELSLIPGSIEAQRKAVTQALGYLDSLAQIAPGSSLEVDTIGGYTDMGNLLGNPYKQNLGNVPDAIRSLDKAFAMAQARAKRKPRDLETLNLLVTAQYALGGTLLGNGDAMRARQVLEPALDTCALMAADPHVPAAMLETAASVTDILGDVYDPGRGYATADMSRAMDTYLLSDRYDEMCHKADPSNDLCRSGVVVSQYKFGSLVEDTDPELAATHYLQGLDVVSHLSSDLMKTTRSRRLKNYMLARLSLMKIRTGHMAEGMALANEAQAGFRDAIARAELDNRARFDMVAFETDLAIDYDTYGQEREAEATAKEVLGILAVLLERSPKNIRWQMIRGEDRMTDGSVESKLGHKAAGIQAEEEGLEEAVRLAQDKDASPEALGIAADGLLKFHLHPGDAQLALGFAQRAVKAFEKPMPAQVLTLARAQMAAGQTRDAAKTAQSVLAALSGPVKSRIVATEIADAHRIAVGH